MVRPSPRFLYMTLTWVLLLIGVLLRLKIWWQNRPLFMDEASLASNICSKSTWQLFQPLDFAQSAPPLFSVACQLPTLIFGCHDLVLRIFPIFSGLLGCWLFLEGSKKLIHSTPIRCLLLYLFAFSPLLLRYSTELKQYGTDVWVAELLLLLTLLYEPYRPRDFWFWAALGMVLIWLSMPAVFILAAIGLYWMVVRQKLSLPLPGILLVGLSWLLSFALYYLVLLNADVSSSHMQQFHADFMMAGPWQEGTFWKRVGKLLLNGWFRPLVGFTGFAFTVGILYFLLGLRKLFLYETPKGVLLFLPLVLCLLASALGLYSLLSRLLLFSLPLVLLVIGKGVEGMWNLFPASWKWIVFLPWLPVLPLQDGWQYFQDSLIIDDSPGLLQKLGDHCEDVCQIWVHPSAVPTVRFYTRHHARSEGFAFAKEAHLSPKGSPQAFEEWMLLSSSDTVWLLYAHLVSQKGRGELQQMEEYLLQNGVIVKRLETHNTRAFLFHRPP